MSELPPIGAFQGGMAGGQPGQVVFDRDELGKILNIYGRMVAAGQWKDYAIRSDGESAVFGVFRRASEMPLYRVVKTPAQARKQGLYSLLGMDGRVLKRGSDLALLLRFFDRKLLRIVD